MYQHAVIGGTFDHLHAGHRRFIQAALDLAPRLTIAVSTDEFASRKKLAGQIEPFETRRSAVAEFVNSMGRPETRIVELTDNFGIAAVDAEFDVIAVTPDTYANAETINAMRADRSMPPLTIAVVELVKGTDSETISSERIRRGAIGRDGIPYAITFPGSGMLSLPVSMRHTLQIPFGTVIEGEDVERRVLEQLKRDRPSMVITIGDIVTRSLIDAGYQPGLAVVDGKTQRQILPVHEKVTGEAQCVNRPGSVEQEAALTVRRAIETYVETGSSSVITIDGEEDLLALPAVLYAPLGSVVLYGLAGRGIVYIFVGEDYKAKAGELLKQFRQHP